MAHVVLKDFYLNGAIINIDDTVIYGRNVEEFLEVLDRILSQMAKFNVRLKPRKCFFNDWDAQKRLPMDLRMWYLSEDQISA